MKKFLISVCCVFALGSAVRAQNNAAADTLLPVELQRQMFIYQIANKYNDVQMTKTALYNILAQAPGNTTVMDSLAMLYFQYQEFVSAALISQDIIAINPNDLLATEIAAVSFEQLGVPSKSIPLYEKMYLANNDISLLYQISFLQYSSKRYDESAVNLETVIEDKLSMERFLVFPTADKQQQQVSLLAAAYRLKGMIEADQGNVDMATEAYNKALELVPDFQSVKDLKIDLGQ